MRWAIGLLLALGACGQAAPPVQPARARPPLAAPRSIEIMYGMCMGECPVFTVTISADGKGELVNDPDSKAARKHAFPVSAAQFAAVAAALDSIRPPDASDLSETDKGTAWQKCDAYATDFPVRIVLWNDTAGKQQAVVWDTGCKLKRYEQVQPALDKALALLPVAPWIGDTSKGPLASTRVK